MLALVLVFAYAPSGGAHAEPQTLRPGQSLFWTGPQVARSPGPWTYGFKIDKPGTRLRIGIDHPEVDDSFTLEVSGAGRGTVTAPVGIYSNELLIKEPNPGIYNLTVRANDADDTNFRVRAKLESQPPGLGTKTGAVLPNLQVLPAHEASFLFPVSNGGFGDPPQGADTDGAESCHPEEHAEDLAVRCLRFAFGVRNTGLGPLQLFHEGGSAGPDRPLFQRIQRADGTHSDRPAGTAKYHKTHGHYHHDAAIGVQLFQVLDAKKGTMEAAGEPRTKGFAHREELLRDWDTFYPVWSRFGIGLGPGWADIYEWDRPGNYIDFGFNGDGRYVVQMEADPVKGIRESNEKDNAAYTYLEVTGSDVEIIEVGRGKHPWDPCKIEVGPGGHPDPKGRSRPRHCSRDTT